MTEKKEITPCPRMSRYTNRIEEPFRPVLGREEQIASMQAAFLRPELCNVALLGEAGSGKALTNDTLIPTVNGPKEMGSLTTSDQVFAPDGKPVKILGIYPQGKREIWRVAFNDGTWLDCDGSHLFSILPEADDMTVKSVEEIWSMMAAGEEPCLPPVSPLEFPDAFFDLSDMWLAGFLWARCIVMGSGRLLLDLSYNQLDICERSGLGPENWYLEPVTRDLWRVRLPDGSPMSVDMLPTPIQELLDEPFARNSLPELIMHAPVKARRLFAKGALTGYTSRGLKLLSIPQAKALQVLLGQLGIPALIRQKQDQILIQLCDDGVYPRMRPPRTGRRFVSVMPLSQQEEMTCIMVDHPDHLYLAGANAIPTHNTTLLSACKASDRSKRLYREIDIPRMIADVSEPGQIAAILKELFKEAEGYARETGQEVVLFIDEFHQVVQLSPAAVEVLKPLLANSGTRGLRVVVATTYEEFQEYIAPNQALVERLQRITLPPTDKETTVSILKAMAKKYGMTKNVTDDRIYEQIFDYTERYVPANSQPRKSIQVLDAMIGWQKMKNVPLDQKLLADVLYDMYQVNVAFSVDATDIERRLNERVLSQTWATKSIAQRLQICVADLNDHTRPMSSFLFTGSTGVGKTETVKQLAKILFPSDPGCLIRFDMTEFAMENRLDDFREELTTRVWEHPFSLVLFDEVEKAAPNIVRLLMQVLDDARLTNRHGREVSFLNTYIIMTTNAGSEIYKTIAQYEVDDTGSGRAMADYDALIRRSITGTTSGAFPPELLGRIDVMVPYQPLSEATKRAITKVKLQDLTERIKKVSGVRVIMDTEDLVEYLVKDHLRNDSDSGGARSIATQMEKELTQALAQHINAHPEHKQLWAGIEGDLKSRNKNMLRSTAHVVVRPVGEHVPARQQTTIRKRTTA